MSLIARRLEAYLAEAARPFDWASHNCCQFAARWVQQAEGLDAMPLVPTPDAASAWRLIHSYGGLPEAITEQLGRAPIPVGSAQVGDVVAMPLERLGGANGRYTVGLCNGRVSVYLLEDGAHLTWPTLEASYAWRVEAR